MWPWRVIASLQKGQVKTPPLPTLVKGIPFCDLRLGRKRVIYFPFEILPYAQIPGIGFPQYLHFPALRLVSPTIYPVRWMTIFLHFGQNVFSPS